ncbi:hypothetical protein CDL12_14765 [Handroanthus impetiginosus]|uniref:DUF4378 domain-containing protein n=1 Tax=Handroanthus impetiginosus TaxID=429701 RepID=A0A2G9H515_9LAMI|nr:hypothetical protein CDL12_14765 [Handroanthus impetiginosus]
MAAKLLHSLTDDNPDLQKQMGCMTGIFQMFDRQHMLTGDRRIVGHSPKRLLPGNSHFNGGTSGRELSNAQLKSSSLEKYSHKNMQDKQRVSTESSRASFSSSSCSSSFSSLDCNRTNQLEPTTFDRMIFPETPSGDQSMSLQSSSQPYGRQTLDLRDFVKDSMYREVQGLSVKDSPRLQPKISDGIEKKQRTPADLKESLRVLAELQEAPLYRNEPRELFRSSSYHLKDGSSFSIPKDAPRFSYDGREINRTSFDSRDVSKSTLKLKDLPRLPLDSREGSTRSLNVPSSRSLNVDSKPDFLLKSMQKDIGVCDGKLQSQQQQMPGNQAGPPSVVAKLMGLDTMPNSISSSDTNIGLSRSYTGEDFVNSFERTTPSKPIQLSSSSKNSWKEPSSPRWRNLDSPMKPLSRFPIEPAPWKQIDRTRDAPKPASKSTRGPTKAPATFPSVYSEIENRLKDLEFTESGKDLRALKQILEAIQAKGFLETPKGQGSNFMNQKDDERNVSSTRSIENRKQRTDQDLASTKKKTVSSQNYESPIVIMKPAKLVEKSGISAASAIPLDGLSGLPKLQGAESSDNRKGFSSRRMSKDLIVKSSQRDNGVNSVNKKNDRTLKTTQTSARTKDGKAGSGKVSGSVSPRMQQKKLELENRSRPHTPSDSSKSKRQSNKTHVESHSAGGRRRPKQLNSQQSDDQLSEASVESKNLISHENEDPIQSNETIIRDSRNAEVTSSTTPSLKAAEQKLSGLVEKKSMLALSEEESSEFSSVPAEYSSPISVLDSVACTHDSPSPIKYAGKTLKVDASMDKEMDPTAFQPNSVDSFASNSTESSVKFEVNRKKLQNVENLVQKLRRLNSSHDEAHTDYIALLCDNDNPDHRYVSEILLASGLLLRDLGSSLTDFPFHPSGHPINPELFLVLEQTKAGTALKQERNPKKTTQSTTREKHHRKLIFDIVNEILARKLASAGPNSESWLKPSKIAKTALNAQKLLRELCSEIDGLQPKCSSNEEDEGWKNILCEDVVHRFESWIDFDGEISGAVLDIERLIFKDLVDEVVIGKSGGLMNKPGRKKLLMK